MNGPTGKGFEVLIVDGEKHADGGYFPPFVTVTVDGKSIGILRRADVTFEEGSVFPILKLERILYTVDGQRTVHTMTVQEYKDWQAKNEEKSKHK